MACREERVVRYVSRVTNTTDPTRDDHPLTISLNAMPIAS
jgi:hypothetical protein